MMPEKIVDATALVVVETLPIAETATPTGLATVEPLPDPRDLLAGQLAPSSIRMYRHAIKVYTAYAAEKEIDLFSPLTLMSWRDSLVQHSTKSPHTINRMIASVKRLVKEMAKRELIEEHVALRFERVDGVKVRALKSRLKQHSRVRIEPADMRLLCQLPDVSKAMGARDAALLATLASSGARAAELASLTWDRIKRHGNAGYYLLVMGKTDVEYRKAPLSPEAYRLLMEWQPRQVVGGSLVFTAFSGTDQRPRANAVSPTGVWKIVARYARKSGIAALESIKPHDFRRFVGTQLGSKDIRKAQRALGHRSIETTARHYVLDDLEMGMTDNLY